MSKNETLPVSSFESLLWAEEVEERVEFADWSASATCSTGGDCSATVGVTF